MSMNKKVPEIRFNDFGEEWNGRCLGSLCLIGDIDHRMPESKTTGIPYLMTGDFCGINGLDFKNAKLISIEDYELLSKKIKPEYGDILFARYASVGSVRYVETKIDFLISYSCAIIKTNNTSYGKFLFYCFQTDNTQEKIELDINTGSQRNIGIDSLKNLFVFLPKSEEQIVIGNYFQKLDSLIIQHQQKHDKLSNIKKAMLEKMFPKPGVKIPEIRFKGFSGEWHEVVLSSVIDVRSGKDYKKLGTGNIPVYGTGGYMLSVDSALSDNENAIGIGRKGTIDKPYILHAPFWTVDTLFYAVPFSNFNLKFVFCLFQKIDWKRHNESTGVPSLSRAAINNVSVYVTNELEQIKIGNYFQKLDTLINQHQQQITKLNNIKQACLSKMFV